MHEVSEIRLASFKWRTMCIFIAFAGIALFFLISEHRAHAFGLLPFLLLAACPLLHLFMHHGHAHGGAGNRAADQPRGERNESPPPKTE